MWFRKKDGGIKKDYSRSAKKKKKKGRGRKTMLKINMRATSSFLRISVGFAVDVGDSGSRTHLTYHQWGLTQMELSRALAQGFWMQGSVAEAEWVLLLPSQPDLGICSASVSEKGVGCAEPSQVHSAVGGKEQSCLTAPTTRWQSRSLLPGTENTQVKGTHWTGFAQQTKVPAH